MSEMVHARLPWRQDVATRRCLIWPVKRISFQPLMVYEHELRARSNRLSSQASPKWTKKSTRAADLHAKNVACFMQGRSFARNHSGNVTGISEATRTLLTPLKPHFLLCCFRQASPQCMFRVPRFGGV
jgi:hypothetical protein